MTDNKTNTERTVDEVVGELLKEAINDFDMAKASAGREVSFSYWFRDEITKLLLAERQRAEGERVKAKLEGYAFAVKHFNERLEIEQTFTDAVRDMEAIATRNDIQV